jgi:hypothetical protein
VTESADQSAAKLRARAARARRLAEDFQYDEAAPRFREWADALEAQALELDESASAGKI